MKTSVREQQWAAWLRAAIDGDRLAYERFLSAVAPHLRAIARRYCDRFRAPASEAEDVVQEVLITLHLKRGTWDGDRPLGPWLSTIVRNKMIDSLRRRGRHAAVLIEDVIETLEAVDESGAMDIRDAERLIGRLGDPQRDIVQSISLKGAGIRETAERLSMTEGAVRVALHRALKTLAALYRSDERED